MKILLIIITTMGTWDSSFCEPLNFKIENNFVIHYLFFLNIYKISIILTVGLY